MSDTKKIIEHERTLGVMIVDLGKHADTDELTEDEFMELADGKTNSRGVDFEVRTKFLKANGYDVTCANMIDSELSVKPPKE